MNPEQLIQRISKRAGDIVKGYFGKIRQVRYKKNLTDVVSEADLHSNRFILNEIKKYFPAHGIISEETGEQNCGSPYRWYVDPLDGTFNFARGIPMFCVMIGLVWRKKVMLSAIFDPVHEELYFAKRGKGAFLNEKVIHCSTQKTWENSYGCGPVELRNKERMTFKRNLIRQASRMPFWAGADGSAGITATAVARGSFDWWASFSCGAWDYVAPALMLEEAGCKISNAKGKKWYPGDTSIVAANKFLYPELLRLVQDKTQLRRE